MPPFMLHLIHPMQDSLVPLHCLHAGSSIVTSEEEAVREAEATGFPVLLKATGGGGGIGIYICQDAAEVRKQFAAAGRCGIHKTAVLPSQLQQQGPTIMSFCVHA